VLQEIPGLSWDMREKLRQQAKFLRYDPAFPKGTNVTFYTMLDNSTVRVLTYERGVEDYTLACGTGCGSLAAVLWSQGKLPGRVLTAHNPGGTLKLTVSGQEGIVKKLLLEGPAEVLKIFEI
jgi:diaminopimelate epimerase